VPNSTQCDYNTRAVGSCNCIVDEYSWCLATSIMNVTSMISNDVADVFRFQVVEWKGRRRKKGEREKRKRRLGTDQMAPEPAKVLANSRKGNGRGSSDSDMIAVPAGTDFESDVVDTGTVRVSSVGDAAGTTKLLRIIIYCPPHQGQQPTLITVHTNTTALGILNKAATLFLMSPNSVSAHYLSSGTSNSQDLASTLEEIRVQDYDQSNFVLCRFF